MNKLKNWNFTAEKLDKVKKPGKFSKLLTYAAAGIGKILSLALQIVSLGHFWRAKSMTRFDFTNTRKWQTSKDNQNVPGWDGAKFDPAASGGKDIMADFRRVPTVWSKLTAAKAAEKVEKDGKEVEKPLNPVVSVMIDQPDPDTGQDMVGREFGHAMLGIEYSRKSAVYDRYERYKLQYGFYPAGKTLSTKSGGMVMIRNNAIVPGELCDEGGLPENDCMNFPIVRTWMDKYLSDRVKRDKKGFEMIVRGLYRSMKAAAPNSEVGEQDLLNRLADVIMHTCVNRNFENDISPKAGWGLVSLASAVIFMAKNKSFEFTKMVSNMFQNCDLEDFGLQMQGW